MHLDKTMSLFNHVVMAVLRTRSRTMIKQAQDQKMELKRKRTVRDTTTQQVQNQAEEVIDVDRLPDKKKVVLIGTSNLKFISSSMLSNHKVHIEKETKYTLKEGQEYIDSLKPEEKKVDAIVLHMFENDITEQTPEHCSEKLQKLCVDFQKKSKDSKVIVSMGLPRREEAINRKVSKLNVLLQEKLGDMKNVSLCDNSNLFLPGSTSERSSGPGWETSVSFGDIEVSGESQVSNLRGAWRIIWERQERTEWELWQQRRWR